MSSLSTLALKSPNKMLVWYLGNLSNTFQFVAESVLDNISFIFCWSMNVQNNDTTPAISFIVYNILSLTNSTLSTADMVLLWTRMIYLIDDCHSPFRRKICILLQVRCHRPPVWPPALPVNLTYILTVLLPLSLVNLPYTGFLCSLYRITCSYSLDYIVYSKSPSKPEDLLKVS
jgi:hypothetical protein